MLSLLVHFFHVFYSSITHFNKKVTVIVSISWCAWESTSKNLPKSQLDMGIRLSLRLSIINRSIILLSLFLVLNVLSLGTIGTNQRICFTNQLTVFLYMLGLKW